MTVRGTAWLLSVLAALVLLVWLAERPSRPRPDETPPLLTAPAARVARIELAGGGDRLTVVRGASGWTDSAGTPWRSDAPDDLLASLATLRPTPLDAVSETTVAEYGLGGDDRIRLQVLDDGGHAVLVLDLGRRNPAWTGRYARRNDDPRVLLVGALLDWELAKVRESSPAR